MLQIALVLCTVQPLFHNLSAVVRHTVFAMRRNCVTNLPQSITWETSSHCLVTQRFLLEIFFLRVIEELSRRNSIDSTSLMMEYFPNCFNSKGKQLFNPSESAIEHLLRRDSSVWTFIKSSIGIKCDFPKQMNNVLLDGDLSEKIHLPRLYCLYLPSEISPDNKEFFLELSRIFEYQAETVDVHSAASYIYRQRKKDNCFSNSFRSQLFPSVTVSWINLRVEVIGTSINRWAESVVWFKSLEHIRASSFLYMKWLLLPGREMW